MNTKIYENLIAQLDRVFRHNRQGSFKTRERYYKAMKRFCRYLADYYRLEKLANIAPKHIVAYAKHMKSEGLSASTIKTDLAAIRFWHDMMPNAKHTLPDNAQLDLERRRFGEVCRAWSNPEFAKMIAVCWTQNHEDYVALISLARYAGLRIHECFRIDAAIAANAIKTWEITIKGKGGKIRTVPINETIRIELKKMLEVTERAHKLFVRDCVPTHRAINNFEQFIKAHRHKMQDDNRESPITFHGLRHTYAQEKYVEFIRTGNTKLEAMKKVSQLLGHERSEITKIYLAGLVDEGGFDV